MRRNIAKNPFDDFLTLRKSLPKIPAQRIMATIRNHGDDYGNVYFAFIDEVGTGKDPNQPFFGVGILIVIADDEGVFRLNQEFRGILMDAISALHQKEDKFEFKFKFITKTSLPYYLKLINLVKKNPKNFIFTHVFEKPKEQQWEHYLELIEKLIENLEDRYIILADYLHKPKAATKTIASLKRDNVVKILQIEGQTSLFLQIADIFLGAVNFMNLKRKGGNKKKVAEKAMTVLKVIK